MSVPKPFPRRALVAGAGGFLGGAIVRGLTDAGWNVRGLVRSAPGARRVEDAGGFPVSGDVLDPASVELASRGCELIVHVAAANPYGPDGISGAERVRAEGARNLLRGASHAGVRRLVLGSGYWVYADQPGTITERSPLDPRGESLVNWHAEEAASDPANRGSVEVVVVRPGMVYGNGSWFRSVYDSIRAGSYRYIDEGTNAWSFVALEDAGTGFACVSEQGVAGEVYNLVDGEPVTWKSFGDLVADHLSRRHPESLPFADAAVAYGEDVAHHLHARRACSAEKIRALGWKPRHANVRAGLTALWPSLADSNERVTE